MSSGVSENNQDFRATEEYKALSSPGSGNPEIEEDIYRALEGKPAYLVSEDSDGCPLDIVDSDLNTTDYSEGEQAFYIDENILVCSAEPGPEKPEKGWDDGLKGHRVRNIGIYREHGVIPTNSGLDTKFGEYNMAEVLKQITAEQIEEGYLVFFGSMSSQEEHFHLVASDLEVENTAELDLDYINSYFLYEVEKGSVNFLEGRISDLFGLQIQDLLEENEDKIEFKENSQRHDIEDLASQMLS